MEQQPAEQAPPSRNQLKPLYWIAAAAMVVALAMELMEDSPDLLKVGSRLALVAALVLLGTARPAETRARKITIYALVAIAAGLLLARLVRS